MNEFEKELTNIEQCINEIKTRLTTERENEGFYLAVEHFNHATKSKSISSLVNSAMLIASVTERVLIREHNESLSAVTGFNRTDTRQTIIDDYRRWTIDNRDRYPTNDAAAYRIVELVKSEHAIRVSHRQVRDNWLAGL